jgi:hypothetical protein
MEGKGGGGGEVVEGEGKRRRRREGCAGRLGKEVTFCGPFLSPWGLHVLQTLAIVHCKEGLCLNCIV